MELCIMIQRPCGDHPSSKPWSALWVSHCVRTNRGLIFIQKPKQRRNLPLMIYRWLLKEHEVLCDAMPSSACQRLKSTASFSRCLWQDKICQFPHSHPLSHPSFTTQGANSWSSPNVPLILLFSPFCLLFLFSLEVIWPYFFVPRLLLPCFPSD